MESVIDPIYRGMTPKQVRENFQLESSMQLSAGNVVSGWMYQGGYGCYWILASEIYDYLCELMREFNSKCDADGLALDDDRVDALAHVYFEGEDDHLTYMDHLWRKYMSQAERNVR